jgi:transcriptional regulator with PAS, ATPase and Fis domain
LTFTPGKGSAHLHPDDEERQADHQKKTILYYSQKKSWSIPCARPFRASIKDMQKAQSIPIRAESGCGKECFDHSMHHASARGKNPFIFNDPCYLLKL